ncbi:MAG: aldo/keto reductase [Spirochaetes bacterium]|nr:aldo/keto reductase [Spirochaetota bacterium]
MNYRQLGGTGKSVSALGFGAMRLPMADGHVKMDEAVAMLRHGFDLGITYVDSAFGYCNQESEIAVGKAIKGRRDKLLVSTKFPPGRAKVPGDYRRTLEIQLKRLDTDYVDLYHFHGINKNTFHDIILAQHLLEDAEKAKSDGLIRHISFSFHDKPENMREMIDTGVFDSVLCQYNLLDQSNKDMIAYAHSRGLGVVIMGPVGGGRLAGASETFASMIPGGAKSTPEIALRFVLSNPHVSVCLSGMGSTVMVDENTAVASHDEPLTSDERARIEAAIVEQRKLAQLYCTGCGYCIPCPQHVAIPKVFQMMNYHRVYGLTDHARGEYKKLGEKPEELNAAACSDCGACEKKCPQNIPIRQQLAESHRILAAVSH